MRETTEQFLHEIGAPPHLEQHVNAIRAVLARLSGRATDEVVHSDKTRALASAMYSGWDEDQFVLLLEEELGEDLPRDLRLPLFGVPSPWRKLVHGTTDVGQWVLQVAGRIAPATSS